LSDHLKKWHPQYYKLMLERGDVKGMPQLQSPAVHCYYGTRRGVVLSGVQMGNWLQAIADD
jgi:hypothetical protein